MKNSSAELDPPPLVLCCELPVLFLFCFFSLFDRDKEGWAESAALVVEMDRFLGPTRVPSTRDMSSASAWGGDSGEEKGGRI